MGADAGRSQHGAQLDPVPNRPVGGIPKWAWTDPQCGAWSGYRHKTPEAAQRAAERHNQRETQRDKDLNDRYYRRRGKIKNGGR